MKYISAANAILDTVIRTDGVDVEIIGGGPVAYGYGGFRLYTDDCMMVANVGADYIDYYGDWMKTNNMPTHGMRKKSDFTNHQIIRYNDDGSYKFSYQLGERIGAANYGFLRMSAAELEPFIDDTVGVYVDQPIDFTWWKNMAGVKERHGFKIMWEIQDDDIHEHPADRIKEILPFVDIFSINDKEGMELFELDSTDSVANYLANFEKPCFFRMGERGSALIIGGKIHFVPSVKHHKELDPTGCGNCSTAAAMYAFCEGYDPYTVAIYANIAASYNIRQNGVIPKFTPQMRAEAVMLAKKLRKNYD